MLQKAAATKQMELYARRREMYRLHIAELHISKIMDRLGEIRRIEAGPVGGLAEAVPVRTRSLTSSRLRRRS